VQAGATVYVTSEGISGVKRRLVAIRRHFDADDIDIPLALVSVMPNLGTGTDDRELLKKEIQEAIKPLGIPVRMIVIDTLRRAIPGKSENDQKDMSIFVENCEDLARAFKCHVNAVHHSPRSDDNRSSGSNSIDGAADVMLSLVRSENGVSTAEVVRFKDGKEGATIEFDLHSIEVGTDRRGVPLTSCFVNILREPSGVDIGSERPAGPKLSAAQQRLFDVISRAIDESGSRLEQDTGIPPGTRAISREMAKRYAKTSGWWEEGNDKSANSRFNSRLNELAGKKAIGLTDRSIWKVR
jgi:hypothetical protein